MAKKVAEETKSKLNYQVGTMIELPRAALKAGEIAETAEFFSFGTNDLTQTALRHQPRRCRELPRHLHLEGNFAGRSVRVDRPRRRRRTDPHRDRTRPQGAAEIEARNLRRAWRRSRLGRVLPRSRTRLCVVLAVPRADRAACRGASRARQRREQHGVISPSIHAKRTRVPRSRANANCSGSRGNSRCFVVNETRPRNSIMVPAELACSALFPAI